MNAARWVWRLAGGIGLLATLLMVGGLVYAVQDVMNPKPAAYIGSKPETPVKEAKSTVDIVALGDSLTVGTGDSSGKGYVQRVRERLEALSDKPVNIIGNYAVGGSRSEQLLEALERPGGIAYGIEKADLVLFTIGGNDLFAIGQNVLNGETDELDPEKVRSRMPEPLERMERIMRRIAEINPSAKIVYVGVYNPFYDLPEMRPASVYVHEWNVHAARVAAELPAAVVVPTFDLFQWNLAQYIYTDHFHPNGDGYERIADRVMQALE